jgi:acetyltransferase-like isoleucine patch superfamily enzyme
MFKLIKSIIYQIWPKIYPILPKNGIITSLNQRIIMSHLFIKAPALWRVEKARQMGVKVGNGCRFYSLNLFSEPYLIEIGDNVIISGEVMFITHDGGIYLFSREDPFLFGHFGRIKIGNNCFIGIGSIILPNVEIGDNCIIGAGSIVRESIPENSVAAGNPAKVILKTDMYRRMRLNSKATLRDIKYAYPNHEIMPEDMKHKLLLDNMGNMQLRKITKMKKNH